MVIAGAGGHAREIRDILDTQNIKDVWFYDDINNPLPDEVINEKVIRNEFELKNILTTDSSFILGTGDPKARKKLFNLFVGLGGNPAICMARTAIVSERIIAIGQGCNIMHRSFISNRVSIGKGCLINAGVQIHHDITIGAFVEIAPGAILLGKVKVGDGVFIGAGAIIFPGVSLGDGAVIGGGSVVTKDVLSNMKVKGNPAG